MTRAPSLPHLRFWTPCPLPVGARLARGWRHTRFEAGGAVARLGRRSRTIDRLLCDAGAVRGAFVGAWNPCSRVAPVWRNRRALARLQAFAGRLGIAWRAGTGSAVRPAWSEAHLLLFGDWRRAVVLARRFGQHAVLLVRRGGRARIRVLR